MRSKVKEHTFTLHRSIFGISLVEAKFNSSFKNFFKYLFQVLLFLNNYNLNWFC